MCHCFHWLWCKYSICHFVETQVRSQCVWYCDSEQGCVIDTRAVLVMSLWSNFSVINWVVWSVCVFSLCFGTCAQYTSKFTPAAYRVIVFLFFVCVSIYAQAQHRDLFILSRFLSAKVSGVSSYGKLIPELASSHMVSITFSCRPCRFLSPTFAPGLPRPGPGRGTGEWGNEGKWRKEGKWGSKSMKMSFHTPL